MVDFFLKLKKKKLCSKGGFSLAELLVAMLIMSLAGMIALGGIAVATRVFQDLLLHSQAQMVMKEYMSELRSGFRSADLDAELNIDATDSNNPAFAHSGMSCSGYYTVIVPVGKTDGMGTIMFQPTYYDYEAGVACKTKPDGYAEISAVQLISNRLSEDFPAKVEYSFDAATQMFSGTLTIKSNGVLSSGEHVELTGSFGISPIN